MKRLSGKVAAIILVTVMIASLFPASVFAENTDEGNVVPTVVEQNDGGDVLVGENDAMTNEATDSGEKPAEDNTEGPATVAPQEPSAQQEPSPVVEEPVVVEPEPVIENTITSQPEDAIIAPNDKAVFKIETIGKVSSYKWQYSSNGESWKSLSVGSKKSSVTVTGSNSRFKSNDGYLYRCIVTFKDKTTVTSDAATLHVSNAQSFTTSADSKSENADVSAEAPAGTFPTGTEMVVSDVDTEDCIEAINEVLPDAGVADVTAVDISFVYEGEEKEPANDNQVEVTLKSDAVKLGVKIVHIEEIDGETIVTEIPSEDIVSIKDGEIVFKSDAFSTYAVVVEGSTFDSGKQYVIFRSGTFGSNALNYNGLSTSVTVSGGAIDSSANNIAWTIESTNGGYYIYYVDSDGTTKHYLYDSQRGSGNDGAFNTTTDSGVTGTVWSITYSASSGGFIIRNVYQSRNRYIRYYNGFGLHRTSSTALSLAEVQPPASFTVHYVDENGNPIEGYPNQTILGSSCSGYTFPRLYDVVIEIPGYTYHDTYLTSYSSSTSHGDQIVPELLGGSNWQYQKYGFETYYSISNDTDIYVVYGGAYGSTGSSSGGGGGGTGTLPAPDTGKYVIDNHDGTYTLSMSITGKGDTQTKEQGANVIMIFDVSSSMINNRVTVDGETHTRLHYAKEAAKSVVTTLLGQNVTLGKNLVEMTLIPFDGDVDAYNSTWYTSPTDLNTYIGDDDSGLTTGTGTNWELALRTARSVAATKAAAEISERTTDDVIGEADPTYIIFVTDGEPSWHMNGNTAVSATGHDPLLYTAYVNDTTGRYYFRDSANYMRATDEARGIVQDGYYFYTVGIYGTLDVLGALTNFAYFGKSLKYEASDGTQEQAEAKELQGTYFFPSTETAEMNANLAKIADLINNSLSLAGVSFEDGIATDSTHATINGAVGGTVAGVTYTKVGGVSSNYTVKVDSQGNVTFKVAGNEVDSSIVEVTYTGIETVDGNIVTTEGLRANVYSAVVDGKTYQMAIASYDDNGELVWDLSPLGTLEKDATYSISFLIWPNQEAYDYVTDLNNGAGTVQWKDSDAVRVEDSNGNLLYYKGGAREAGYPNIVKYENGTYAVLTNTHQDVEYYIATTDEDGKTTYSAGTPTTLGTPDPAELTATTSTFQKKWNSELQMVQLARYLYDTRNDVSKERSITFKLFMDEETINEETIPYKTFTLGWDADSNSYIWYDDPDDLSDDKQTVTDNGHTYSIGTVWAEEFALAPGIMLSQSRLDTLGLDASSYSSVTYNGTKYYILEDGHDYTIDEIVLEETYSFDYVKTDYHPMLVNGTLTNVTFTKDAEGNLVNVTDMAEMEHGIRVDNYLRGGINLDKVVLDADGNEYDDDTKFSFTITLQNDTGVFVGQHIPWYSVNGLYYHDAEGNYIPSSITGDTDEDGLDDDGNIPVVTNEGKTATINLTMSSTDAVRVANVPVGTTYTIKENIVPDGYDLVEIVKDVVLMGIDPDTGKEIVVDRDMDAYVDLTNDEEEISEVSGEIVPDRQNNVTFTNQMKEDVAFYVYHSSSNTIEKILFADARVQKTYVEAVTEGETTTPAHYEYSFNIVEETGRTSADTSTKVVAVKDDDDNVTYYCTGGYQYGGYYHGYAGAVMTDEQIIGKAESGNAVYGENNWASDAEGASAYTGKSLTLTIDGAKIRFWSKTGDKKVYPENGSALVPKLNTVYYLKEVPDIYLQTNARWVYDLNQNNKILNIYLLTCIDDNLYGEVGFTVADKDSKADVKASIANVFSYQIRGESTLTKVKPADEDMIKQRGLLGVVNITNKISAIEAASENAGIIVKPYWNTLDGVKVATPGYKFYNTGTGTLTKNSLVHTKITKIQ